MTSWTALAASVRAAAKLNLHLRVIGRRPDGYHLIDSVAVPIGLFDSLTIRITPGPPEVALRCTPVLGIPTGGDNLAVRAAQCILRHCGATGRVSIDLVKRIPIGAGLGGGSSDAAAVLRILNALLAQPLEDAELQRMGLELGADVPLFLVGRPVRMRGIGEHLELWLAAETRPIVVAFSGAALSTREVYAKYDDLLTMSGPPSTIRAPTSAQEPLPSVLHNDLEAAAFLVQPALPSLKQRMRSLGAEGVLMTGSGSAVFGYWRCWDDAQAAAQCLSADGLWADVVRVLDHVPAVELEPIDERKGGGRSPSW